MSEGAAVPSTNGSSAPTAAAPGVASSTPSPKSGEGAVVPQGDAGQSNGTPAPKAFAPIKTKLRFGDGQEEEVELSDEETLQRRLVAAKGFDRAQKKALELERREAQRKEAVARKDFTALKELGFDPEAYFVERLQNELRREQMSDAERAKEDHEARVRQAEQRALAAERKAQMLEQAQAEEREWAQLQPRLGKAMREAGMLEDTFAWETVSSVAQEYLNAGIDAPPETVIAEAAARDRARFDERLAKLTPQTAPTMWGKFSAEVRKVFGYLAAQEHIKARSNIPAPTEPLPKQVEGEPKQEAPGLTERAWLRGLR